MIGDELFDYPCGFGDEWTGQDHCSEKCPAVKMKRPCPLLPVFRAHIKLRKDHDALRAAVLGDMTAGLAREIYLRAEEVCKESALYIAEERLHALADVVAKL